MRLLLLATPLLLKPPPSRPRFIQLSAEPAPEDQLAKEMTHDLEMNFNKIAPFGALDPGSTGIGAQGAVQVVGMHRVFKY